MGSSGVRACETTEDRRVSRTRVGAEQSSAMDAWSKRATAGRIDTNASEHTNLGRTRTRAYTHARRTHAHRHKHTHARSILVSELCRAF